MEKAFRKPSSRCSTRAHPIGRLLTNQIFSQIYVPRSPLSNSENWRSVAIIILEIFKKHRCALYFVVDSSQSFSQLFTIFHSCLFFCTATYAFPYLLQYLTITLQIAQTSVKSMKFYVDRKKLTHGFPLITIPPAQEMNAF